MKIVRLLSFFTFCCFFFLSLVKHHCSIFWEESYFVFFINGKFSNSQRAVCLSKANFLTKKWAKLFIQKRLILRVFKSNFQHFCGQVKTITTTEFCQGQTMRWGVAWSHLPDVTVQVCRHSLIDICRDFHWLDWNYAFIYSSKQLEEEDTEKGACMSVVKRHKFHTWFRQMLECVVFIV